LSELEKLSVYPGRHAAITVEHVRTLVSLGNSAQIYELGQSLGQGSLQAAVPTLLDLLGTYDPLAINSAISTHFRNLMHVKVILEAGGGRADEATLAEASGLSPYQVKLVLKQVDLWSVSRLKAALSAIEDSHRGMVTSRAPSDVILEALAVKLAGLARLSR
jgi:DNA polymerase III delta subunit